MKYLPTVDVWANGVQQAIIKGHVKLQVGQRVSGGGQVHGRFVGVTKGGSIYIAWNQETEEKTLNRIKDLKQALGL